MGIPDVLDVGEEFDADAFVLLVFLYLRGACRFCRKYDAIFWYSNVAQFAKHGEAFVQAKGLRGPVDRDLLLGDAVRRPRPGRASLSSEQTDRGRSIG